ncbi:hypothetical protein BUE80_DR005180 [Diplocarpon rosae]|nr:hypothetical protein BUE80_DR005180 [Diplocarpon rosae]
MSTLVRTCAVLFAAFLATGSLAGPAINPKNIEVAPALQERIIPSITLGSFDISSSHVDDILFDVTQTGGIDLTNTDSTGIKATCISCTTHGNVTFSTDGVGKNATLIEDITSLFENPDPDRLVVEAFDLNIKVAFENVGGRFELGVESGGESTYSFPLFSIATPFGAALSEDLSFGMVLFVDLVFSLSAEVDWSGGFEFAFPEGAFIMVDPLKGTIVDHGFTGGKTNALPVIVTTASQATTFKASLRVRVQAGTTVILFGTGFDFELGIFVDLIEYVATISSTPECPQLITQGLDVAIGAYAHAVGEINYMALGVAPAVITTILEVPLPNRCLGSTFPTSVPAYVTNPSVPVVATSFVAPISSIPSAGPAPLQTPTFSPAGGYPAGSAVTPAPALITSTLYSMDLITLTTCSNTVLRCPPDATAEYIITKTKKFYTTICPPGASVPTTLPTPTAVPLQTFTAQGSASIPAYSAVPLSSSTPIGLVETPIGIPLASYPLNSALPPSSTIRLTRTIRRTKVLTTTITRTIPPSSTQPVTTVVITHLNFVPCPTAIVETIYTPNWTKPVYTMPTGVAFPVPFPNWNEKVPKFTPIIPSVPVITSANVTSKPVAVTPTSNPFVEYMPSTTSTPGYDAPSVTPGLWNTTAVTTESTTMSTTGSPPNPTYPISFQNASSRSIDRSSVVLALVMSIFAFALL